jgi:RNA polymerase sigma-70 factor (sigma-E family)
VIAVDGGATDPLVEELYRAEARTLVGMLWVYTGDRAVAEELVQEAFLKLQTSWRRIRDPQRAGAFVRTTAFNLARSRFRHLRVARRYTPDPPRIAPSAEDGLVLSEDRRAVIEAVRALPHRQRECVVLRYYGGLTDAETARQLGVSVNSVKTHLRRALDTLEATLEASR